MFLLPTATDDRLGADTLGIGPTAVVLRQSGPWTYRALVNHIWSVAGRDRVGDVSTTFLQPSLSDPTKDAWTFTAHTKSTDDWKTEQWSVPIRALASRMFRVGGRLVSVGAGLRYWAERPGPGPQGLGFRLVVTRLLPRRGGASAAHAGHQPHRPATALVRIRHVIVRHVRDVPVILTDVATRRYIAAVRAVAVRELKNRLSAYLRDVARGEVILVTDRGRVVAELRRPTGQVPATTLAQALERLHAEGLLTPGLPQAAEVYRRTRVRMEYPSERLLDADRGER